jgi:RNA recognition motif-containing protein
MSNRLFVRNLSPETTENDVYNLFSSVGRISQIVFLTDRHTGGSKDHCTVDMETVALAKAAVQKINGHLLHGCMINVSEKRPPNLRSSPF